MAIPHNTRVQLQSEGMTDPGDLVDFTEESMAVISQNLRRPGGRIPDPDPNAAAGATIPTPPFILGAKSQMRLIAACDLMRYYETVGRSLSVTNIKWNPVIRNFQDQWKALKSRRKDEEVKVPKIGKALPVMKWSEAFTDFLHRVVGIRMIPLAYVVRENVATARPLPPLAQDSPHSEDHGSIEEEMVEFASHTHWLFRNDSSSVYYHLEEAVRSTSYASSIKPYQRKKDGRGAWLAIVSQYAGKDKWDSEIKKQDDFLHSSQWKGQNNFTLGMLVTQHRAAYVSMVQCAEHVDYQLPNAQTRVKYLLEAIKCSDAGLQAAMAMIRNDDGPAGKLNDFELTAAYLLPYDPVAKRKSIKGSSDAHASIAESAAEVSSTSTSGKPAIGKTGVHLRWYKAKEFAKLSKVQKRELTEWRQSRNNKDEPSSKRQKSSGEDSRDGVTRTLVSKLVAKELGDMKKAEEKEEAKDQELRTQVIAILEEVKASTNRNGAGASVSSNAAIESSVLKSILKKAGSKP